jgi:hypothetical protein
MFPFRRIRMNVLVRLPVAHPDSAVLADYVKCIPSLPRTTMKPNNDGLSIW